MLDNISCLNLLTITFKTDKYGYQDNCAFIVLLFSPCLCTAVQAQYYNDIG